MAWLTLTLFLVSKPLMNADKLSRNRSAAAPCSMIDIQSLDRHRGAAVPSAPPMTADGSGASAAGSVLTDHPDPSLTDSRFAGDCQKHSPPVSRLLDFISADVDRSPKTIM